MPTPKGRKRDVTEALDLLKRESYVIVIQGPTGRATAYIGLAKPARTRLVAILKDIDARTGRRDPSKRKQPTKVRR